jgi:lysophospholipase L1-like esterase
MMRKLFLVFCLAAAGASAHAVKMPAENVVTLHLAGDSTLAEKRPEKRPETGWGEYLTAQFRSGTVLIANHAQNGRSTRTFISEGRWQALLDGVKPGDYVLIQFGHNDQSIEKSDRYTPEADYHRNLQRFVSDVREHQATPVLMTPVARRRFDEQDRLINSHGVYPDIVRAVATEQQVTLIDMQQRSEMLLQAAGPEASKKLFLWLAPNEHPNYPNGVSDNTHFSPTGAQRMAVEFATGLRGTKLPLAQRLTPVPPH